MRNIAKRAPFAFTSLDLSFLGAGLLAAVLAVILYLLGDLNVLAAGFLGVVIGSSRRRYMGHTNIGFMASRRRRSWKSDLIT